jgi:hypothetical protein
MMPDQRAQNALLGSGLSTQQTRDLAAAAYIYGYPLVIMDVTRRVMTNVPKAGESAAPINQFGQMRSFPDETMTKVVSPNADTLYSFAFLDLSKEPVVLSVPEMGRRYYLMQMLDAWTNVFACPGTRTTGSSRAHFAIVGPRRAGSLPDGVSVIKSPTSLVWIIGRTQTNGKDDYPAVHVVQDQYKLTPLSAWGKTYKPPDAVPVDGTFDMTTPPVEQVAKMEAGVFYGRLNALMKDNPPANSDADTIKGFAAIGIGPGKAFDLNAFEPPVARCIEEGFRAGQSKLLAEAKKPHGKVLNGWEFADNLGHYGTDYPWRAVVALLGLGANLPEDAIYPRTTKDSDGQPLTGADHYEIQFAKGQLPPVGAFWSITLYNSKQFFAKNPIHRFAIGDRDMLTFNEDGSLTLYVQHESPGKTRESNWLPAPQDSFNLAMRLYWPKRQILEGDWNPPAVHRIAIGAQRVA